MYHTVYEIGLLPAYGFWHGLIFVVIGVLVFRGMCRARSGATPTERGCFPKLWGMSAAALGGFAALVMLRGHIEALLAYKTGHVEIVEGLVHVLREQPANGHAPGDLVEISGRQVEVDYFVSNSGYSTTISHGGVLRDGVVARCSIRKGLILRLDIKDPMTGPTTSQ